MKLRKGNPVCGSGISSFEGANDIEMTIVMVKD